MTLSSLGALLNVAAAVTAVACEGTSELPHSHHVAHNRGLDSVSAAFQSSATGGTLFAMELRRVYDGPRMDFDAMAVSDFPRPADVEMCKRWAVLTSISKPTKTAFQLAALSGWCVVVVGDKNGPTEYNVAGVKYLTPDDQDALPYRITQLLPWNNVGRKSIGFLYAIHHGAEVIYDVADGSTLTRPREGVPHADSSSNGYERVARFSSKGSSFAHNPYSCFGAPGVVWPRGYPLSAVQDRNSSTCEVVADDGVGGPRIGVVQLLANKDPDVDAIYRLTYPPGGLPFSFDPGSPATQGRPLRGVPAGSMTPYNAQATLHFPVAFWGMLLPVTVHRRVSDIWRSYFTQALLPSVGAVAAFAPASVEQARGSNAQSEGLADFQAEMPLYERSGALVKFLVEYSQTEALSSTSGSLTPTRIEDLIVKMYEYGVVEGEDVALTQAWLQDLLATGYDFRRDNGETATQATPGLRRAGLSSPPSLTIAGDPPDDARAHVMLAIAVVSARPERRDAIRNSWLAWGDERVELRFFTEAPASDSAEKTALDNEMAAHGDLILMDITPGMNFGLKLVWAMRWMSHHFTFEFFLRLDDDYFLCLGRLLDELDATLASEDHPQKIYAGHMYCTSERGRGATRIDEAYLLLSNELVLRIMTSPDLKCGGHAGTTAGWWFTEGNPLNELGDVQWVHDPRLDHTGEFLHNPEGLADICTTHMGVHHTFPDMMPVVWEAARRKPGPRYDDPDEGTSVLNYVDDGGCKAKGAGVSDFKFDHDNAQLCDTFTSESQSIHCGAEGC